MFSADGLRRQERREETARVATFALKILAMTVGGFALAAVAGVAGWVDWIDITSRFMRFLAVAPYVTVLASGAGAAFLRGRAPLAFVVFLTTVSTVVPALLVSAFEFWIDPPLGALAATAMAVATPWLRLAGSPRPCRSGCGSWRRWPAG